jgi:hypothetical protein
VSSGGGSDPTAPQVHRQPIQDRRHQVGAPVSGGAFPLRATTTAADSSRDARAVGKIALIGPIAWRTPPKHYGPWEQVTGLLADGLVRRGVEVTLFATLDSGTAAVLDGVSPRGYAEDESLDGRVWEGLHVAHALARSAEFDLVHNHLDWLPLAFAKFCRAPLLTTIHGFSDRRILPAYQAANSAYVSRSRTLIGHPSWTIARPSITASTSAASPFRPAAVMIS